MYESFYHLAEEPFRLTPDHRLSYKHPSYERAMIALQHALHLGEGFIMVTGTPGMGKTTLINDLLTNVKTPRAIARLDSIHMEPGELLQMVAFSFGLTLEARNTTAILRVIKDFLTKQIEAGRGAVLIVDEAQGLSKAALDELRLLSNMQNDGIALLQIFLVGQEKLRDLLLSPGMEQLHQRMLAACHLDPLTADHTHIYVKHRLKAVGWSNDPVLSDDIFPIIYNFSHGIPRPINMLCSRLLLNGYMNEKHELDVRDIRQTIEHLGTEKLIPFAAQNRLPQTEKTRTESPAKEVSDTSSSDSTLPENLDSSLFNSESLPIPVLSKYSKEANLWRVTFFSFILGVAAAVCFVAVLKFFL